MSSTAVSRSAERWGPLWGARPADWALSEDQQLPTYEDALRRVGLEPGQLVLDIGCGVGAFVRLAAARGARPFGLDASEALLDVARRRLPDAPPEPDYSRPGALEDIATKAGLHPESAFETTWSYEYADDDTLRRALVAPAGIAALVGPDREEQVKDAIVHGLASHRAPDGGYRLENTFHSLIARAR